MEYNMDKIMVRMGEVNVKRTATDTWMYNAKGQ